jgi:hypothetical protein
MRFSPPAGKSKPLGPFSRGFRLSRGLDSYLGPLPLLAFKVDSLAIPPAVVANPGIIFESGGHSSRYRVSWFTCRHQGYPSMFSLSRWYRLYMRDLLPDSWEETLLIVVIVLFSVGFFWLGLYILPDLDG